MGNAEKDLFVEMMKKGGQDPKLLADCVKQLLLQDNTIQEPGKAKDVGDDNEIIESTKEILRTLKTAPSKK